MYMQSGGWSLTLGHTCGILVCWGMPVLLEIMFCCTGYREESFGYHFCHLGASAVR